MNKDHLVWAQREFAVLFSLPVEKPNPLRWIKYFLKGTVWLALLLKPLTSFSLLPILFHFYLTAFYLLSALCFFPIRELSCSLLFLLPLVAVLCYALPLFLSSSLFLSRSFCSSAEVRCSRLRAWESVELILSLRIITGTFTSLHTLYMSLTLCTVTRSPVADIQLSEIDQTHAYVQILNTQNRLIVAWWIS